MNFISDYSVHFVRTFHSRAPCLNRFTINLKHCCGV